VYSESLLQTCRHYVSGGGCADLHLVLLGSGRAIKITAVIVDKVNAAGCAGFGGCGGNGFNALTGSILMRCACGQCPCGNATDNSDNAGLANAVGERRRLVRRVGHSTPSLFLFRMAFYIMPFSRSQYKFESFAHAAANFSEQIINYIE
jgi:hypothetical protein